MADTDALAAALQFVLRWEGGYSNHPADRGGPTRFGITQATARAYGYAGPMRELPLDVATRIYRDEYWTRYRCDQLPVALAVAFFDTVVNMGPKRATRCLQRALKVPADGVLGPVTIGAAQSRNARAVLTAFMVERKAAYVSIASKNPSQRVFLRGWLRRVADLGLAIGKLMED